MQDANIDKVYFGGCNLSGVAYPTGGTCERGSIGRCILKPPIETDLKPSGKDKKSN